MIKDDRKSVLGNSDPGFQQKRLQKILVVVGLALCFATIEQALLGHWIGTGVQTAYIFGLIFINKLSSHGKADLGASLFLISLTILMAFLVWENFGLQDEALFAFPGILIFSAMIGSARLFLFLLGSILLFILFVGFANTMGWHADKPIDSSPIVRAIILDTIVLATAFSVWILRKDLKTLMTQLTLENQKAKLSQARVQELVHHDPLTGLPNRILARDRFDQAYLKCLRNKSNLALIFLDFDNFKTINDSLGHSMGDEFLKVIASRLSGALRKSDTVCRLGGDEFLVIIESVADKNYIAGIAFKLQKEIDKIVELGSYQVSVTCSIGISVAPQDGSSYELLLKSADMAMYHAKEQGKNRFQFFNDDMNTHAKTQLELLSDMRSGIQNNQFELYYQPKIDLHTGVVVSAEALIRWMHPEKGMISPLDFIPLAEKSGLIQEIGEWVLRQATKDCKKWHSICDSKPAVAVNVSSVQLKSGDLNNIVRSALNDSGLDPSCLELELTESVLFEESSALQETVSEFRQIGVKVSIDDFGTGYSNLAYLKKFDVEILKIDRSFIQRILDDPHDQAIVSAIVQISKSLQLEVVAEGIENEAVAAKLRELGCHLGQGFYWSKPIPFDDFIIYYKSTI